MCQAPRGSNNRVNEQNTNRNNNNRLFDSQNNNKGGYSVGVDADDYTGEDNVRLLSRNSPILLPSCCSIGCRLGKPGRTSGGRGLRHGASAQRVGGGVGLWRGRDT